MNEWTVWPGKGMTAPKVIVSTFLYQDLQFAEHVTA